MRKRRVGVTARSRQNVGGQVTGTLQFDAEMAAPLELRTPTGTCGGSCNQSADGSMATMAQESTGRMQSEASWQGKRMGRYGRRGARNARTRRCLILRQGASPLRPLPPFPRESVYQNGSNRSRVRKPRKNGAPLTDRIRSEEATEMRERGPTVRRAAHPLGAATLTKATGGWCAGRAMRLRLILRQGASPLRPPNFPLDREGPSHGSRDRNSTVS
jgi:hypothetical protein